MHIDYTVHFDQAWRIGSGEAAGRHLDSLVRRDGHGLPFLPGSTVRGLVADAVRKLARALDREVCDGTVERRPPTGELGRLCGVTRDGEPCPLCSLTGSPHREPPVAWGPARLVLGSGDGAVWEPSARRALGAEAAQVPGLLTRPHPHTSIDHRSGRAADERLFTLEESSPGLDFAGSVDSPVDLPPQDLALLLGALRFIREMGGGRRRGLGGCRIRIDHADLGPAFDDWRAALAALADPEAVAAAEARAKAVHPRQGASVSAPPPARRPETATTTAALPAVLQLDAVVVGEVVAGRRPEAGNLIAGLDFVPGSTVRGALAGRWSGDRSNAAFLDTFISGRVRFGPLYPAGKATAAPVPLSWHTCKHRPGLAGAFGHGRLDLLLQPGLERCPEEGCGARLVAWAPERGLWKSPSGESLATPPLALSPHNRIEPTTQTVSQGALFAYQALAEGRRLRGFVRAEDERALEALWTGLGLAPGEPFRLRVGRRKGALGYLECTLSPFPGSDSGVGLFPDATPVPQRWPASGLLRIDLLTPAIVRDALLRCRGSLQPADLGRAIPAWAEVFAACEIVAGWNSTHRLPKADQLAVAAGSSYLLRRPEGDGEAQAALTSLRRAALEGIGERRSEGFGVLAIREIQQEELPELRGGSR